MIQFFSLCSELFLFTLMINYYQKIPLIKQNVIKSHLLINKKMIMTINFLYHFNIIDVKANTISHCQNNSPSCYWHKHTCYAM